MLSSHPAGRQFAHCTPETTHGNAARPQPSRWLTASHIAHSTQRNAASRSQARLITPQNNRRVQNVRDKGNRIDATHGFSRQNLPAPPLQPTDHGAPKADTRRQSLPSPVRYGRHPAGRPEQPTGNTLVPCSANGSPTPRAQPFPDCETRHSYFRQFYFWKTLLGHGRRPPKPPP